MFNKSISAAIAGYVRPDTDRNENSAAVERPDIHDPIETLLEVVATREIRYSVIHPRGYVLDRKNPAIRRAVTDRPLVVVVDQQVHRLYGSDLLAYLEHETNLVGYLSIDGSETAKSWGAVQRICDAAIEAQLPRNGIMLGVGGGVTLDITGFAASIFRRGVDYVRMPTSLIGLIDVAVGIKHGINIGSRKSIVGTFYPAMLNINDPTFLATLSQRHIACGIAEIIKMAVVRDEQLFTALEHHVGELLEQRFQNSSIATDVLIRSERLMMQELQSNLFESQFRRLPDFGHTFSPAIEFASGWSINHGEAVGMDMLISAAIAAGKGLSSQMTFARLRNLLAAARLPLTHEVCRAEVLMSGVECARQHRAGNLNLVVPLEIGKADFIQDVSLEDVQRALALIEGGWLENAGSVGRPWRDLSPSWTVA